MAQAKKALAKKSRASNTRVENYKNFIGGRWVSSRSGDWIENRNPADTRDVVGRFPASSEADVDTAVAAATEAFNCWGLRPAPRRAEILFLVGEIPILN